MTAIQRFALHGTIMNPHSSGPYVRHEDHLAAMQGRCLAQIEEPAGAAPAAAAPFGYVNTQTGQFFTDVEPCRRGNEGHWRTVYLQPSAVAGAAPAGWQLVPATPTREWIASVADGGYEDCDCASLIADILSRAPAAPALEAPVHQCCNSWFLSLPEGRQAVLRDDKWMLASAAYEAGRESCSALEAPAAPAVPLKATPEMRAAFRRAYRAGAYRDRGLWGNRMDYALDQMLAAAPQAPAAPSGLPSGWVPCILTHDGQYPEEVAYGPQIMMDRLKKWLSRYFELLAQKVLAEPVQAEMLAALQAVALDVVHVGAGENAISDSARDKVETVLEKIGAPWPSPVAAPAAPAVDAADSARLDFVLQKDAFIVWTDRDDTIRQCQLLTQDENDNYHVISGEHRFFNTPRQAIDAAIAAQAAAKGATDE